MDGVEIIKLEKKVKSFELRCVGGLGGKRRSIPGGKPWKERVILVVSFPFNAVIEVLSIAQRTVSKSVGMLNTFFRLGKREVNTAAAAAVVGIFGELF